VTYGGGPSGGYIFKNLQLYYWNQDWCQEKEFTKLNGFILIRKIDDCPTNSYYYEAKCVNEIPEDIENVVVWN
jgi:hypothetical protein